MGQSIPHQSRLWVAEVAGARNWHGPALALNMLLVTSWSRENRAPASLLWDSLSSFPSSSGPGCLTPCKGFPAWSVRSPRIASLPPDQALGTSPWHLLQPLPQAAHRPTCSLAPSVHLLSSFPLGWTHAS